GPVGSWMKVIVHGTAARQTRPATTEPGTIAAAGGTGRPPTRGNQRGSRSPQGRIRPRVRVAPIHAPSESIRPQAVIASVAPSGRPIGHGVSQVSRASG